MLPIIDMESVRNGDCGARRAIAREIGEACEATGFLYAANHGVPDETVAGALGAARDFFARPERDKRRVQRPEGRYRGYIPISHFANGKAPVLYEAFLQGIEIDPADPAIAATKGVLSANLWPEGEDAARFRQAAETYWNAVTALSTDLLRAFGLALGLAEDSLLRFFEVPISNISYLHYPKGPERGDAGDLKAHRDTNALTVLLPDPVGGLEVRRSDGTWMEVQPLEDCFIINIGNMMECWSGGRFKSTLHRVNPPPGVERYSIGYFAVPSYDTVVCPLGETRPEGSGSQAQIHAGEDLAAFIASCDAMTEA